MEINIKLNLPEPVNKLMNPLASSAGETLSNIWEGCFARLNTWSKKEKFKHEQDFLAYKEAVKNEFLSIPESDRKEPRLSLIGPAIESSKYYIAEPVIRQMFAKLIAADMDMKKEGLVHHSFVNIVQQMSPTDANLLKVLPISGPLVELRLYAKDGKTYTSISGQDIIYIPGVIDSNFLANAISINNLARLGIVELNHVLSFTDTSVYEVYKDLELYKQGVKLLESSPNKYGDLEISSGMFQITPLGKTFKKICLS